MNGVPEYVVSTALQRPDWRIVGIAGDDLQKTPVSWTDISKKP